MDKCVLLFRGSGQNPKKNLNELIKNDNIKNKILEIEKVLNEVFNNQFTYDFLNIDDFTLMQDAQIWQPMNFITQIFNYYKFQQHKYNIFSGAIGHSQGILSACIASLSSDEDEFMHNVKVGAIILAYQGMRMKQNINRQYSDVNMISVKGMTKMEIDKYIKIEPNLINTYNNFIYCGTNDEITLIK